MSTQNRMKTRASNSNKHPGAIVQAASRPLRDPAVVQMEKEKRKARKEKKEQQIAQEEAAESELEDYRSQQKAMARSDEKAFPRHRDDSNTLPAPKRSQTSRNALPPPTQTTNSERNRSQVQKPGQPVSHPLATTAATNRKRKSDQRASQLASDDEQTAAPPKKKTISESNLPVKRPAPRPVPRKSASTKTTETFPAHKVADKPDIPECFVTLSPGQSPGKKLCRTETMIGLGFDKEITQRRPVPRDQNHRPQVSSDVEMEDVTPKARDFQRNAGDLEPYETPMVLRHRRRQVVKDSDEENRVSEKLVAATDKDNRKIKTYNVSENKHTSKLAAAKPAVRAREGDSVSQTASPNERSQLAQNRTTALNKVVVTKATTLDKRTHTKAKTKKIGTSSVPISLSDEDDSLERDVVLNSPEKGKDFRQSSKTGIKVKQESKRSKKKESLIPFPKVAEPLFSTIALPIWIADYYSQGDGWSPPDESHRRILQDICDRVYGESFTLQITEDTEAWKKACMKLWDYRSRMKARAMQAVEDAYIAKYGADSLEDVQQRIEFGEWLCSKKNQVFQFKGMLEMGKAKGQFESPMIIQTMSIHYSLAVPKKDLKNFKIKDPEVAYAMATAACECALTLWRDDLLKYEKGSLKMNRTSTRHDFSGTNYRSCTLGWLAGIQQKRRVDKRFFGRVCDEAREILGTVKGKVVDGSQADNQYLDCEIADRAGIKSDESEADDEDGGQSRLPGPSESESQVDEKETYGVQDDGDQDDGDDEDDGQSRLPGPSESESQVDEKESYGVQDDGDQDNGDQNSKDDSDIYVSDVGALSDLTEDDSEF